MSRNERSAGVRARPGLRLLADIGGTHARFAVARRGGVPRAFRKMRTRDFGGPAEALAAYLREKSRDRWPESAAIAVAAPVAGDRVKFTNGPWAFSVAGLGRASGFADLHVLNDFEALAWALPVLPPGAVRKFGSGRRDRSAPRVVLGPGTGLGVACFVPETQSPPHEALVVASEGGHMTLAAETPREAALVEFLRARFGHVSAERVISGPGLRNIYEALRAIDGADARDPRSSGGAAVARRARRGTDPRAKETVSIFSAMAGAFAGDLALVYGARGGVYLAGGVIPRLGPLFDLRAFRRRFVAKGRYRDWVAAIPTYLVVHPHQALVGLAHYLDMVEETGGAP